MHAFLSIVKPAHMYADVAVHLRVLALVTVSAKVLYKDTLQQRCCQNWSKLSQRYINIKSETWQYFHNRALPAHP